MSDVRERAREWTADVEHDEQRGLMIMNKEYDAYHIIRDLLVALDTEKEDTWRRCVEMVENIEVLFSTFHTLFHAEGAIAMKERIAAAIEREMGGRKG